MFTNNNNYNLINGNIITLNNIVPTANSITVCDGCIESINSINNKYVKHLENVINNSTQGLLKKLLNNFYYVH